MQPQAISQGLENPSHEMLEPRCLTVKMESPPSERRDVLPKVMRQVQAEPPLGNKSPCRCACLMLTEQLV